MTNTQGKEPLNGMLISDTAIRQPVLVTMIMLLAVVIGLLAYSTLPVSLLPEFPIPYVSVSVTYPGASPQSVVQQVTEPIEEELNTLSGVRRIISFSSEEQSSVFIEFREQSDSDQALQDVRAAVGRVEPRLPQQARDPTFELISFGAEPILRAAIASNGGHSPLALRELIDREFVPEMQRVDGVGSVTIRGGQERQINVGLDLQRLQAAGISPAQVSSAIRAVNDDVGLGRIEEGERSFGIRSRGQIQSIDDIASIPISGTPYRISDVATIEDGIAEIDSYARLNGEDTVTIAVVKQTGANTVSVGNQVKQLLDQLATDHPDLIYTITTDNAREVQSSVNSSIEELILAVVAAFIVVLAFFRNLPNTLVSMAGTPIILICTFAAMRVFEVNINILSLLALSLSVGLVIDDAIVVRENIFRYMEHGYTPLQAASRGTAEVSLSVLAMTLTIVAVFLPVTFASGIAGFIFKSFGITIASAIMISMVEAFILAPMLSANLFRRKRTTHTEAQDADMMTPPDGQQEAQMLLETQEHTRGLSHLYGRVLHWSLRHRFVPIGIAIGILIISIGIATTLPTGFLPAQESRTLPIVFEMPPGTSLDATDALVRQAEAIIMQDPDVVGVQTDVGTGTTENASFTIQLPDATLADEVRERLRPQLAFLPNVVFGRPQSSGGQGTSIEQRAIQIQVRSDQTDEDLAQVVARVEQAIRDIPGTVDVGSNFNLGRPEIQLDVDPNRLDEIGITNDDVDSSISALINGETVANLRENGEDTDIVVQLASEDRADLDTLRSISIPTSNGNILLSSIASIDIGTGPTVINRTNQQNVVTVGANIADGYEQSQVQQQVDTAIAQIDLPASIALGAGLNQQDEAEAFQTLFIAMGLSVLFVYMVLASQFGSFLQPLVIMLAMPFSFLGAFVALRIANLSLDITSMIGLILLLGLVVKNSIILVDFTNRLRAAGLDTNIALERAGAIRLRPILMTALSLIAAAIPSAFGIHLFSGGEGIDLRRGLAAVIIGGMITSTLLTLLIVPTAYSLLDSFIRRAKTFFRREPKPQLATATAGAIHSTEIPHTTRTHDTTTLPDEHEHITYKHSNTTNESLSPDRRSDQVLDTHQNTNDNQKA